jgi:putative phosphoribosyl transferase
VSPRRLGRIPGTRRYGLRVDAPQPTPVRLPFADRTEAGRALGERLAAELEHHPAPPGGVLVLGLPRGGVVVAAAVARRLGAPLDAFGVRKLGLPGQPELAMGAIASGGVVVLNEEVIYRSGVSKDTLARVVAAERAELERRERAYRGDRPPVTPAGALVILVDDGLATGATARAALRAVRRTGPAEVWLAVPVCPRGAVQEFAAEADRVVCLSEPRPFSAVGRHYRRFDSTTDGEVRALLAAQ